jgi:hypothetical protein
MGLPEKPIRVLYSFPHKLGASRICYTAWQQVNGLAAAGADLLVYPGALQRPVPEGVKVFSTLARGKLRSLNNLQGVDAKGGDGEFWLSLAQSFQDSSEYTRPDAEGIRDTWVS